MSAATTLRSDDWSDLRQRLTRVVRRRVPTADVEDVVQTILFVVMTDRKRPAHDAELHRWVAGVTRHKIADYHRAQRRVPTPAEDMDGEAGAEGAQPEAHDMLRWAARAAPPGNEETLEWLLREGEGEDLESIAAQAQVPAPRVRKRVSRLRAHFRAHWQKELALLAALGVLALGLAWALRPKPTEPVAHDPDRGAPHGVGEGRAAEALRKRATEECIVHAYRDCLRDLDMAKGLDPAGDSRPELVQMRREAAAALRKVAPQPAPRPPSSAKLEAPAPEADPAPAPTSESLPVPLPSAMATGKVPLAPAPTSAAREDTKEPPPMPLAKPQK